MKFVKMVREAELLSIDPIKSHRRDYSEHTLLVRLRLHGDGPDPSKLKGVPPLGALDLPVVFRPEDLRALCQQLSCIESSDQDR